MVNKFKETGIVHYRGRSGRSRTAFTSEVVQKLKNTVFLDNVADF